MEELRKIAEAESLVLNLRIDFNDRVCRDIGAFLVLGEIRRDMLPILRGGHMYPHTKGVLDAVGLKDMLQIRWREDAEKGNIWPFRLRQRRAAQTADPSLAPSTTEEKVDIQFVETVNTWLSQSREKFKLSIEQANRIATIIGEVLDNAKRHSNPPGNNGEWSMAGFMHRENTNGEDRLVCHVAIYSPGRTIFETLQLADENMRASVAKYSKQHARTDRRLTEEVLWTLSALQDGITRVRESESESRNGTGMMTLVEVMDMLGHTAHADSQPKMTVISGQACILVQPPYTMPKFSAEGLRTLWFNGDNTYRNPPDPNYVFSMEERLPGTLISMRFYLDPDHLVQVVSDNG